MNARLRRQREVVVAALTDSACHETLRRRDVAMTRLARLLLKLGPAKPSLADDETVLDEFVGPITRVTLTDERIVVSRRAHKSIAYYDIEVISGGWNATNARYASSENTTMVYGLYIQTADYDDSALVGRANEAATLIKERSSRATLI